MANTTFVDKTTVIQASWLQEINNFYHNVFSASTTVQQARTALGIGDSQIINENTISRTLVLSDAGNYIVTSHDDPVEIIVPSGIFSAPTTIVITQGGSGQVTVSPALGVTINTPSSTTTKSQYSSIGLLQTDSTTWYLVGDLT